MLLYRLGWTPDCSRVQSNVGYSLPWPETKRYVIGTLGLERAETMLLILLDFDQGTNRGPESTEGSVGSMLGEAGVQPSFGEQTSEPSDSRGTVCMTLGNPVANTRMTTDDGEGTWHKLSDT